MNTHKTINNTPYTNYTMKQKHADIMVKGGFWAMIGFAIISIGIGQYILSEISNGTLDVNSFYVNIPHFTLSLTVISMLITLFGIDKGGDFL